LRDAIAAVGADAEAQTPVSSLEIDPLLPPLLLGNARRKFARSSSFTRTLNMQWQRSRSMFVPP